MRPSPRKRYVACVSVKPPLSFGLVSEGGCNHGNYGIILIHGDFLNYAIHSRVPGIYLISISFVRIFIALVAHTAHIKK